MVDIVKRDTLLQQAEELLDGGAWELNLDTETQIWTSGTRRIHEVSDEYTPTLADGLEFYHPEDQDKIEQAIERCREQGEPFEIEARLVTANGHTRWVRTAGERAERDGTPVIRGVIIDITDQKQREQRLSVLHRIFRHNTSQDLNVIRGNAEHLQDTLATTDESTIDEAALREQAEMIERRAQDLIDFAEKAEHVQQTFEQSCSEEELGVRALLEEVAEEYRAEFADASLRIDGGKTTIITKPYLLRQAIEELLENALVHSDRDTPTVTLRSHNEQDRVRVTIADDGPGIPEIERNPIEEDGESKLEHASGLGLWYVNWLMLRLGGEVTIDDNQPRGTVVELDVPKQLEASESASNGIRCESDQ